MGLSEAARLYPGFGSLKDWHYLFPIDSPPPVALASLVTGSLSDRAEALLKIVETNSDRGADKWPIRPLVVRAMALELTAAFSQSKQPASFDLLKLLALLLKVPADFLLDPVPIFQGKDGKGQAADPRCKLVAEQLDALYFRENGKWMAANSLAQRVGEERSCAPPSRSSIRTWRADPDYSDFVQFFAAQK